MTRSRIREIIWAPGVHALPDVAEAVEEVLASAPGQYTALDVDQASYLLATFALATCQQYVRGSSTEERPT